MTAHERERLTAYADGELDPGAAAEVERHLAGCTECARELALVRRLKGAMRDMQLNATDREVWKGVHRRITRPAGWLLIIAGAAVWVVLAAIQWFRQELTLEWLAASAVITGLLLLLLSIGYEQYRHWKSDRYKDVEQ